MIGIENTQRVGVFFRVARKIVMAGLVMPFSALTKAEVTLDGTLGPAGSLAGPNFVIPNTVGQTVGTNLFHSFGLFNINTGESATFTGPSSIENVLGRVTGGSSSFIDGLLRTQFENASPNLFLLNPAGVLFGPNASLDVQGSFHVSTADYLKLGDGGRFEATNPENSVLTVAPPEAFGFLGDHPAPINFQGSELKVPAGEIFSVVGGDINIIESTLQASGGQINLASVASAGEAMILGDATLEMGSFARLGKITMAEGLITDDLAGGGGVFIRSGQFVMDHSFVPPITRHQDGKGIHIEVTDDLVMLRNSSIITDTYGPGKAGDIAIKAGRLQLMENARINARTQGEGSGGSGGNITIEAGEVILEGPQGKHSRVSTSAGRHSTGNAGNITITANNLQLSGGSGIVADDNQGSGVGGSITIKATDIALNDNARISAESSGIGIAGRIFIKALDNLRLVNDSQLSVATDQADAGDITLEVGSLLHLRDSSITSSVAGGTGDGGDIILKTVIV
jgi:filamentous hemagglutinin family protein